jgi:ABC-type nickel/cobalt efflux system permease component RcnA
MLALATGLMPCPLTTFILTYSIARGKLAVGLAAVGGVGVGVILTLVSFAIAAIAARGRLVEQLARWEATRVRIGWTLELLGALGVLLLGLAMLAHRI